MDFTTLSKDEKRELFTTILQDNEVIVEFTKVDGELRQMPCTLSPSLIPVDTSLIPTISESKKERKVSPDVIRVFCTDKQAWRSFRIDSVISITVK